MLRKTITMQTSDKLATKSSGETAVPPSPKPPSSPSTGRPQPGPLVQRMNAKDDREDIQAAWQRSFCALSASSSAGGKLANTQGINRCAEFAAEIERIAGELPAACRSAGLDEGEVSRLICSKLFLRFALPPSLPQRDQCMSNWSTVVPDEVSKSPQAESAIGKSTIFAAGCAGLAMRKSKLEAHTSRPAIIMRVSSAMIGWDMADTASADKGIGEGLIVANKFAFMEETRKKKSISKEKRDLRHPLYDALVTAKGDIEQIKQVFLKGQPIDLQAPVDRAMGLPLPLIYAIAPVGSLQIVELLLEKKADIECRWRGPGEWETISEGMSAVDAACHLARSATDSDRGAQLKAIKELLSKKQQDHDIYKRTEVAHVKSAEKPQNEQSGSAFFCKHLDGHPDQIYVLDRQVGAGTFGSVRLATHRSSGQIHAVKSCPKDLIPESELWSEIELMQQMDHPHISRLYYTFEDPKHIFVASEMCSGGELFDAIIASGYFSEKIGARLFKQSLSSVVYLHVKSICHRDLKPENYLLSKKGEVNEAQVKLIDFGTAKRFDLQPMTTKVCTVHYVAPEVLKRSMDPYTEKVDVWSLGVMLFVMISGNAPFHNDDDVALMKQVKKGKWDFKPEVVWSTVSPEAKDLVSSMLCKKVDKRLSATDSLHHAWCAKNDPLDSAVIDQSTIKQMKTFVAHSRLKKVALQIIARQVPDDTIQKMRDLFISLDEDGSGSLTMDEMDEAFAALDISEGIRLEMRQVMQVIDVDGNGSIKYTEFIAATMKKQDYMKEEVCRAAFHVFDVNGDGAICLKDLATLLKQFEDGEQRSTTADIAEVAEILNEADRNGDGKLEFDEFMLLMADRTMEKITGTSMAGRKWERINVEAVKSRISEREQNDEISNLRQEPEMS